MNRLAVCVFAFCFLPSAFGPIEAQPVPVPVPKPVAVGPDGSGWVVDAPQFAQNVKFQPFLGRDAIWLKSNTHVTKTAQFADGTVEFDLAPMDNGDFAAFVFRRQSFQDHENVYFRLRRAGDFMAMQYAPRVNGSSTWQLNPEFNVTVDWPRNQWTHVRAEIHGSVLQMFVGNVAKPQLTVSRLRNGTTTGLISFWARVNDKPEEWAAAISNLKIAPAASSTALIPAKDPPAEFIRDWEVSNPLPAEGAVTAMPSSTLTWSKARAEDSGVVFVNRLVPVQKTRSVVFARKRFRSESARRVRVGIGYSDDVTVFLNGEPVYSGVNAWDSRTPQLASFVDARWETVWLSLKQGENELVLAVSDDQRFGWGFSARFEAGAP